METQHENNMEKTCRSWKANAKKVWVFGQDAHVAYLCIFIQQVLQATKQNMLCNMCSMQTAMISTKDHFHVHHWQVASMNHF